MAKQKEYIVSTAKPERKRTVPKSAFKKGEPNPHQFKPGESGRTRAKKPNVPDDRRLVSRALRVQLPSRAPDDVCRSLHMPLRSSWAQCLAKSLMIAALRGDVSAVREIYQMTEGSRFKFNVEGFASGDEGTEGLPLVEVHFVAPPPNPDGIDDHNVIDMPAEPMQDS